VRACERQNTVTLTLTLLKNVLSTSFGPLAPDYLRIHVQGSPRF
jgi:hypothetical protein